MNVRVIATTSTTDINNKDTFNVLSGKLAGVCYNEDSYEKLENESLSKTEKRIQRTKGNGHHSVYEHEYVTLYLENIPKLFAMLLNNEQVYVTSEKSARYTKMNAEGIEKELYDKWLNKFVDLITERYGDQSFFSKSKIHKLAQENARYFLSIYNPTTCMAYTVSYRQLNYIYGWLQKIENHSNELIRKLAPFAKEFSNYLDSFNLIDEDLKDDGKNRDISLIAKDNEKRVDYFGDVYCTTYQGSWAELAQAQRHRTLDYQVQPLDEPQFYVPKIIRNNDALQKEWLEDMQKVKDNHPQGELVQIIEKGTPENFILKSYERLCTCAQLEIMDQTKETLEKYKDEAISKRVAEMFAQYSKGARCTFPGFKCNEPCGFKDGIKLDREI